jgi:DNA-binding CsgD family transcriptional regulator
VALSSAGSRPPAQWKRYRGGTAPRLWLDRAGDGSWEKLLADEPASMVDPMWVDEKLLFVSDRAARPRGTAEQVDRQANLWIFDDVLADEPGDPRQLTDQGPEEGYVRDASTDGKRVIWHTRGRLMMIDGLSDQPHEIEITVPGAAPRAHVAKPTRNLGPLMPDHGGDASLLTWRGNAYWLTHRDGPARALVADSSVRVREPAVLGTTGYGVVVSDAEGADCLEIHHLSGGEPPRRIASGELGFSVDASGPVADDARENATLQKLIADALDARAGEEIRSAGFVAVSRPSGERAYAVMVTPLLAAPDGSVVRDAAIAIFVADPSARVSTPPEVLSELYQLTNSEAELVRLLASGLSLDEAAEKRGISLNTARSHLKHAFAKTDTSRQGELVRLIVSGLGQMGE